MRSLNAKKDILTSVVVSMALLGLWSVAKQFPIQSYSGFSVCGTEERYSVLNNDTDEYSSRVKFFEDYDKKIDPAGEGMGAAPAIACPDGGKIALYLL